jgi:acyl-coenzyme A thioesterase PaaI-like protein
LPPLQQRGDERKQVQARRRQPEGTILHLGGRTALAQARLTDEDGRLHAHATSSCLVQRP